VTRKEFSSRWERIDENEEVVGDEYKVIDADEEVVGDTVEVIYEDEEVVAKPTLKEHIESNWRELLRQATFLQARIDVLEREKESWRNFLYSCLPPGTNIQKIRNKIASIEREKRRLKRRLKALRIEIVEKCPFKQLGMCRDCKYEDVCAKVIESASRRQPRKIRRWYYG